MTKSINLTRNERIVYESIKNLKEFRITEIADLTGKEKRNVGRTLNNLMKKNLINRIPDLLDLRTWIYYTN